MTDLKRCPFCGGEAKLVCYHTKMRLLEKRSAYYYVRCKICRATSQVAFDREEAIEAWNRRADNA